MTQVTVGSERGVFPYNSYLMVGMSGDRNFKQNLQYVQENRSSRIQDDRSYKPKLITP